MLNTQWISEIFNNKDIIDLVMSGIVGNTGYAIVVALFRVITMKDKNNFYYQNRLIWKAFEYSMDTSMGKVLHDIECKYDAKKFRQIFNERYKNSEFIFNEYSFVNIVAQATGLENISHDIFVKWIRAFYFCLCTPQAEALVKYLNIRGIIPMEVDGSIISRIDENYIENNTVPENSPAIDAYYRLDYDVDIISKAVCSNNVVVDDGLLKAMIQEIKKANKVLFICGEGGIGKTTLLLQLSVELSKENPVYFAQLTAGTSAEKFKDELDRTFSISYNTDALCYLFIDNPFSNGEIIETIHNWLQYNDKIIVILADRVLNIQLLFDSKYVLPYWKEASTYVLIGQGKTNFFKNMHPSNRIVELNQSECWKRKVVDKMISNISIKVGIERALLEVHITDKIARKLTPYEIFYNACIKYNKLQTKDENGIDIRPKLKFSWDEWNDLFCKVCPEFARVFSVIAALALFSIPTSVDVISKYSSLRRSEVVSFLEKIPKKYSAPVKYQDSLITLRHDLIADFYFATFDSDSARQVVETTLLDVIDILDDDSVIKFEKMFLGNALSIEILRRIG